MLAPDPIETDRLVVRLIVPTDLSALLVINSDAETTRFLPYGTWKSPADAEAWFQRISKLQAVGNALQFVIVEKQTRQLIGACVLFRYDEASARAELGFVLGRAHLKQGFMREALTALIECAFRRLSLRRLEAEVDPANPASVRLLRDLGFTREGLLRQRYVTNGQTHDVEVHGMLSQEWPAACRIRNEERPSRVS